MDEFAEVAESVRARALSALGQAVIITDLAGLVIYWNPAAESLYGFTAGEAIGQRARDLILAPTVSEQTKARFDAIEGPASYAADCVQQDKSGRSITVQVVTTVIYDDDGRAMATLTAAHDVSEQRAAESRLAASERRYRTRFEQSGMPQAVLDMTGLILSANDALCRLLGRPRDLVVGQPSQDFRHETDDSGEPGIERVSDGHSDAESWERVLCSATGDPVPVLVQAAVLRDARGIGIAVECFIQDISGIYQARRALRDSEANYRAIVETAQEGIWTTDIDGATTYANHKLATILGRSLAEIESGSMAHLLGVRDNAAATRALSRSSHQAAQHEVTYAHPDGGERVLRLNVTPLNHDEDTVSSLVMITDITEERHAEGELRRRALYDELTGLPNRSLLTDRLHLAVARSARTARDAVALLFVDLDHFKLVNDTWGHAAGDRLLVAVAERLSGAVRSGDTVARFGGDEFVIVREGGSEVDARELASRVQAALAEPFDLAGQRSYVSASIGIVVAADSSAEDLIRSADAAMYEAKARGRGRAQLFDQALGERSDGQLALRNDLREALAGGGLELHYQPQVELATGRIIGVEALARWNHPTRGVVPPMLFVSLAEELGLAPALDRWALDQGCRDLPRLRAAVGRPIRLSVNLSASNLDDPELEHSVISTLCRHGIDSSAVELEITETAIMDDPEHSRILLQSLRDRGVSIAIDDFGTGYSSLGYLRRLPATAVKIDRTFIQSVAEDPDSAAIAGSIIELCRALRMDTVAEGIETVEQLSLLRRFGCVAGQGFLWSRALPVLAFVDLVGSLPRGRFDVSPSSHREDLRVGARPVTTRERWTPSIRGDSPERRLSPRELEIVTRLCRGKRVPAIAADLYLSQGTVRNQLSSVYRKLGVRSQQELLDLMHSQASTVP